MFAVTPRALKLMERLVVVTRDGLRLAMLLLFGDRAPIARVAAVRETALWQGGVARSCHFRPSGLNRNDLLVDSLREGLFLIDTNLNISERFSVR